MRKLVSSVLVYAMTCLIADALEAAELRPLPANLGSTLDLYLSADHSYQSGDLITQSQLKEFQVYLRRTRGTSFATHQKWSKMALADRAGLSQLFYNGGAKLLREAAQKTGGYADIDKLARTPRGQMQLKKAIKSKDLDQMLQAITRHKEKQTSGSPPGQVEKSRSMQEKLVIYTADDYLAALEKAVAKSKKSADAAKTAEIGHGGSPQAK